jgi:NADPH:quinone reductase-like Zn-dependent oxidoreductase
MRAMVLDGYGFHPRLAELPPPSPSAGEALVRVRATSVNPIDWKQAGGVYRPILRARFPGFVPGYDVAGEVLGLGEGVQTFSVGDRVHIRLSGSNGGANAEQVCVPAAELSKLPASVDFAQGAGMPLAGLTALQGLRDGCGLRAPLDGARVLVVGASGGVGHLAVQVACAWGAHVTGVCSARNADFVRSLGAHAVVDYAAPDAWKGVAPFHAILDCVGEPVPPQLARLVPGGRFASCLPGPGVFLQSALNPLRSRKVAAVMMQPNAADLSKLDELAETGKLRVHVDSRFPLEQLGEAWARSRTGRAVGKIVVELP